MAADDWRIRVEVEDEPDTLLERLGLDLSDEARELASELKEHRLVVSREEDTVFVYASSAAQAEQARKIVEAELAETGIKARQLRVEHWLADEDRWDDEEPGMTVEEELVAHGVAPWEVRIECETHGEADELADRLEAEGHRVVRRWRYILIGTESKEEADALARDLHGEVEPGSGVVWEVAPNNPFAIFGGLGG
jgi:hypothetical protein